MAGRILVGIDGSEGSRRALAWAIEEAAARGAAIDAVTVCRGGGDDTAEKYSPYITSHQMYRPPHVRVDAARLSLLAAVSEVAGEHPDIIAPHVLEGDPAETLCRLAKDADLLVVGARGQGTFEALLLGSVSSRCAHHSPAPVAIVPNHAPLVTGQAPATTARIVVGVDGSEGSHHALEWAIDEARARDWAVQAVTVWTRTFDYATPNDWPVDQEMEKNARLALDEVIETVAGTNPAVNIEPVVVEGDPAEKLCELSTSAELLVVGCRGHGGFTGLLLGSVATKCAHHSPRPVVIMHHHRNNRAEQRSAPEH